MRWVVATVSVGIAVVVTVLLSAVSFLSASWTPVHCWSGVLSEASAPVAVNNSASLSSRLLRVLGSDPSDATNGAVLFLHGHAGSAQQMRWLAEAAHKTEEANWDWFAVDFGEAFSALDSHILLAQAEAVNAAISHIRNLTLSPLPITIIAHSMGGIVARLALTLPSYTDGQVDTVITLATPHLFPPVSIERDSVLLYRRVNDFWRNEARNRLKDVILVSILGGARDIQIQSQFGSVESILPSTNTFTVFTSHIQGVWKELDHEGVLWCSELTRQLIVTLTQAMVVKQKSAETRLAAYRTGLIGDGFRLDNAPREKLILHGLHLPDNFTFLHRAEYKNGQLISKESGLNLLESVPIATRVNVPPSDGYARLLKILISSRAKFSLHLCLKSDEMVCGTVSNRFSRIPTLRNNEHDMFFAEILVEEEFGSLVLAVQYIDPEDSIDIEFANERDPTIMGDLGNRAAIIPIRSLSQSILLPWLKESFYVRKMETGFTGHDFKSPNGADTHLHQQREILFRS
ncbi:PGAP1-like protein-domain-containing protein [Chytriomyces sp. MP71]|nr:PGAP1-like protein-domain-containing protein [Chytriomyces sp. MP71]